MDRFEGIWENVNIKDNLQRDKNIISKKSGENSIKFKEITEKVKNHKNQLNFSGGEKKTEMLKNSNKGLIDNKEVKLFNKDSKSYIKRFLK